MRLSRRCYAVTGLGYSPPWCVNAGFVTGDELTLVVDTGGNRLAAQSIHGYACAAKPENRLRAINTEKHFDHIGGNGFFREQGVDVWGHAEVERTAAEFQAEIDEFNAAIPDVARRERGEARAFFHGTEVVSPNCRIREDTVFELGGCSVEVVLTPGHTRTNLSVWAPEDGVLFTGDCVVCEYFPNLDAGTATDWELWLRSLDRIEALRPAVVVPGHGPVARGDEIRKAVDAVRNALNDALARGGTSRRGFLMGVAALAAAAGRSEAAGAPVLAYAGCYSSPKGPEGSTGWGKGIYLFEMNPATGVLTERAVFPSDANPSWLAFDPSRTHLYSANETDAGSVSAYSIERASGRLTLLNTVSSHGAGPTHLSVHPSGKWVFVANYYGGSVAVLPVRTGGELGEATDVKEDRGTVGPEHAASAPPGSFAISGHDRPHAHMIQPDPSGRFVLASDLGLDRINVWKFDAEKGTLTDNDPPFATLPPGDGPRYFTFHPNGRWMYSIQEEASTLVAFDYDAARGRLTAKQTISSLPEGFRGTNFTSSLMISADGKFLYAANRLHDSIAWFTIGANGKLALAGEEWTRGDYPRSFNFDPSGNFLYSCNQRADSIATFRVNRKTGALTFTGQYTAVGTPSAIIFLA